MHLPGRYGSGHPELLGKGFTSKPLKRVAKGDEEEHEQGDSFRLSAQTNAVVEKVVFGNKKNDETDEGESERLSELRYIAAIDQEEGEHCPWCVQVDQGVVMGDRREQDSSDRECEHLVDKRETGDGEQVNGNAGNSDNQQIGLDEMG